MPSNALTLDAEQAARRYLDAELGARAPVQLTLVGTFSEEPLPDEGPVSVFSFELLPACDLGTAGGAPIASRHYVVAGQTQPNFFPAYGFDADDAYSFHIGTRFALEMGLAVADARDEPVDARQALRTLVAAINPDVPIEQERLVALFRCGERLLAVYLVTLRGRDVYCTGADCPPGFYELTHHPPQVVLRLHLGKLLRTEAPDAAQRAAVRIRP